MSAIRSSILIAAALVLTSAPAVLAGSEARPPQTGGHPRRTPRGLRSHRLRFPGRPAVIHLGATGWTVSRRMARVDRSRIQGEAFLLVSLHGVLGHELTTPMETTYGPRARAFAAAQRGACRQRRRFRGRRLLRRRTHATDAHPAHHSAARPGRYVIDVAAGFRTDPCDRRLRGGRRHALDDARIRRTPWR